MSMTPQGPGWWEASDRKWYPPELHPDRRAAQPPPAESAPLLPGDPLPLLVSLPPRERQRRWTVLIRPLLAVPLFIVVLFIGIATSVVVVIGWFGALFTARVPDFVRRLVTVYLRLSLRLEAYLMLLTDRFPPFDTEDVPDYPVHVAVPYATRMNRAAVFFRLVLVIPVSLLASVLQFRLRRHRILRVGRNPDHRLAAVSRARCLEGHPPLSVPPQRVHVPVGPHATRPAIR